MTVGAASMSARRSPNGSGRGGACQTNAAAVIGGPRLARSKRRSRPGPRRGRGCGGGRGDPARGRPRHERDDEQDQRRDEREPEGAGQRPDRGLAPAQPPGGDQRGGDVGEPHAAGHGVVGARSAVPGMATFCIACVTPAGSLWPHQNSPRGGVARAWTSPSACSCGRRHAARRRRARGARPGRRAISTRMVGNPRSRWVSGATTRKTAPPPTSSAHTGIAPTENASCPTAPTRTQSAAKTAARAARRVGG